VRPRAGVDGCKKPGFQRESISGPSNPTELSLTIDGTLTHCYCISGVDSVDPDMFYLSYILSGNC
jgi:hypothetical protein